MKNKHILLLFTLLLFTLNSFSQEKPKWDVNNPPGDWRTVEFSVDEGTWMNLDVSPNGSEIVFDLLGDIYTVPMSGGAAVPVRTGIAYEVQPRYSPDGQQICFTSDAGGADNIWVAKRDGSDAKQVTKEEFRLLNNPIWMPDSEYLVARKHFTSGRSLGAGELWMYHKSGGAGLQLTKRKNDQQDLNEPSVSPDGRYVYYSEDMYEGGYFKYNKDPNSQIYVIKRFDREKGETKTIISGPGGASRPQVSPDGSKLAFVRRVRTETVLFIHDLETGEEWPLFDGLSKDQQEAWAIFGVYTGYDWTPDNQNIVIWGKGKIWKVNVASAKATEIPFTVNAKHQLAETVRFDQKVDADKFTVNVIRQARTSPDGKTLVFNAVGYLWKKDLPNGKPKRLTDGTDFEYEPAFSPDGKSIVYATWNDANHGAIYKLSLSGRAKPVKKPLIYL